MGAFTFIGSILVLSLLFKHLACQEPNTDEFFVFELLKNMGLASQQFQNFSGSVCSRKGISCDADKVIKLSISGLGLFGPVPENTIGKLSNLQVLDLSRNKITAFPSDFWNLNSLRSLNLSYNKISGSLSSNIGNFGSLESIDLSENDFSGEIPASLSSLGNLKTLKLARNGFVGSIPSALKFQYLISLDLSSNQLDGSLPDGFAAAFPSLKTLKLAGNKIPGRGQDFAEMKSLICINISGNSFQGPVLDLFQEQLEMIDLSKNQFQGHISQVFNLSHLVYLDLSENQLSGDIFANLSQAQNLRHVNLACNRFSQEDFPQLVKLPTLVYLNLSKTSLTGRIPPFIGGSLKVLDVSHNNLSGEIPVSLLDILPLMETYNFSYNNLSFCASRFSPETFQTAFFGSVDSCPIAANPDLFRRRADKHRGYKLALGLTISMVCLLAGLLALLAVGCKRKPRTWAVKQTVSFKEEQSVSGPFSFQTDSTTWVAGVKQANSVQVVIFEKPLLNVTFADLLSATSNFDRGTLLAEGKFGPVYRGFLPGGIHVAVKVLVHGSTLTDQEAARELEYLGRIRHPNLIPLTGYCLAGDQRIAIYDYMENGNLQNLLHDLPLGVQAPDDWSTDTWEEQKSGIQNVGSEGLLTSWRFRHKIALGTARALAFLHHGCSPPMIHRDVKASSIYLDFNLEPRISDFGLAKVFGTGLDEEIARGSPGYLPPEFCHPEFQSPTPRSDIYCFGVVLFELITGKKPAGDEYPDEKDGNLVSWVRNLVKRNQGARAVDLKIRGTGPEDQMEAALKIGYLCTADLPAKRPSMQQIVGLLKDIEPRGL